jgi:leucyl aminopeptidase
MSRMSRVQMATTSSKQSSSDGRPSVRYTCTAVVSQLAAMSVTALTSSDDLVSPARRSSASASFRSNWKLPMPAELRALYPSRDAYLSDYDEAVDRAVEAGYFLRRDAARIKRTAAQDVRDLFPR